MKNKLLFSTILLHSFLIFSQSVSRTILLLPDTGQTSSYTSTFGEDHDYSINTPAFTNLFNGTIVDNNFVAHSCWDRCQELININLETLKLTVTKTNNALGSTPISNDSLLLLPSIQHPSMSNAPSSAYSIDDNQLSESFKLATNNIYSGLSSFDSNKAITVPFRFDLDNGMLKSELMFINTGDKTSKIISVELELE